MSNQYLSFDVTKQSAPQQLITGRQGDSQLKFVTMLFWDGDKNVPYDLTGKQVAFEALKPDNTHIVDYEGITILDAPAGLVRYSFNEQVFSVSGTMQQAFFKITHTDKDSQVIADSTLEVAINILENRVEFGINSNDYLSEYDDLIAKVEKKFDDYAATVQDSIDKAQAIHEQIVEYTNLINSNGVIKKTEFGDISQLKQPEGNTFVDKLNNEFYQRGINVKWYGATGDGVTDDTQAILNSYNDAKAKNTFVIVPSGTYFVKFDSLPDSKVFCGSGVIVNDGKRFNISMNVNHSGGEKLQNSISFNRYTYGRFNDAAAFSVNANSENEAAVTGFGDDSIGLSAYGGRDSVGAFIRNTSSGWQINTTGISFGDDYVDVPAPTNLSGVKIGMLIDTNETPKNTGIITRVDGNRISVNKWVTTGATDVGVTPVAGSTIIINPTTAIFGQNTVVKLDSGTRNIGATGYELDIINNQPHRDDVNGHLIISDGLYAANAGIEVRNRGNGLWRYSIHSMNSEYGVHHTGGSVGLYVDSPKYTGAQFKNAPNAIFTSAPKSYGLIHATDEEGQILFDMKNNGSMSRFILQRQLASGNVSAPIVFATGDVILPNESLYPDQIVTVTNTTAKNIKITARINYKGLVYNALMLKPYASAMFICDGVQYYHTAFTDPLMTY